MSEHPSEARFVLDDAYRIVEWDDAAIALFGVPREEALGRRCGEVIASAAPGSAPCRARCPVRHDLARGRIRGRATRRDSVSGGATLSCRLTALPDVTGGAVASVAVRTAENGGSSPRGDEATDSLHDLAAFASLATAVGYGSLSERLDLALDQIRTTLAADAAEVFLVEPAGGHVVLTSHRGLFGRAFQQQVRFAPNEGVPGRVMTERVPLVLDRLADDDRYLRDDVVAAGFKTYACVPLPGASGPIGTLSAAFRSTPVDLRRRCAFLAWSAPVVATAVQASLASHLEDRWRLAGAAIGDAAGAPHDEDEALRASLHGMVDAVEADGADLTVRSGSSDNVPVRPVATVGAPLPGRCPAAHGASGIDCPALSSGRPQVLAGDAADWPASCRHGTSQGGVRTCLSIALGADRSALLRVWRARRGRAPLTHGLVVIELRARAIERMLRERLAGLDAIDGAGSVRARSVLRPELDPTVQGRTALRPTAASAFVRCFGSFELHLDGASVAPEAFRRRKAATLLKLLLLHGGRPVDREVLLEALWPGADPDQKGGQLHVLVHELRRVIGQARQGHGAEPALSVEHGAEGYRLRTSEGTRVDVREFERAREAAHEAHRHGDATAARRAAERATALYGGALFEDDPYAEWCWQDRERLHEACQALHAMIASLAGVAGDWSVASQRWEAALRLDPLREDVRRGLMYALWQEGRCDEALEHFRRCEQLLRLELGVTPLPATATLAARIRSGASP